MLKIFNDFLDAVSEFLAHRKGLLPFIGLIFIALNLFLELIPTTGWVTQSNLFLHLGVILAILGVMLAWAL